MHICQLTLRVSTDDEVLDRLFLFLLLPPLLQVIPPMVPWRGPVGSGEDRESQGVTHRQDSAHEA